MGEGAINFSIIGIVLRCLNPSITKSRPGFCSQLKKSTERQKAEGSLSSSWVRMTCKDLRAWVEPTFLDNAPHIISEARPRPTQEFRKVLGQRCLAASDSATDCNYGHVLTDRIAVIPCNRIIFLGTLYCRVE